MKNRFGFIPIVLPAIVMVLIIGLINLGGPQDAQAQTLGANDPQLATLTFQEGDGSDDPGQTGGTAINLTQAPDPSTPDAADDNEFAVAFSRYTASVDYDVTSTVVQATTGDDTDTVSSLQSSPNRPSTTSKTTAANGSVTTYNALVPLRVGSNTVTVRVTDASNAGAYSTYRVTITRAKPVLAAAVGSLNIGVNNGSDDPNQAITAFVPTSVDVNGQLTDLTRPDGLTGYNAASTTYEVTMAYAVTSTVVHATVADAGTMEVSFSSRMAPSTTTPPGAQRDNNLANYSAIVPLGVGDNRIQVKVMGKERSNEYQTYTVNVKRNRPMLTRLVVEAHPGDSPQFGTDPTDATTGPFTYSRFGPQMASTTLAGLA